MGCGICAPKASQYRSAAVSPTGAPGGKTFAQDSPGEFKKVATDEVSSSPQIGAEQAQRPSPGAGLREAAAEKPKAPALPGSPAQPPELDLVRVALPPEPANRDGESSSEDEADIEAAMRAAISALTPRSGEATEVAASQQVIENSKLGSPGTPRHQGPHFPDDVEISISAQKIVLTWARWGRNSWRIKEEEKIKAMQHIRYPRTARAPRPAPAPLSPQPTPTGTPREMSGPAAQLSPAAPLTGAAKHRAGGAGSAASTVRSRDASSMRASSGLFDEMKEEQRESMDEQGARMKLTKGLGASAAQAFSMDTGTPGFGVDTPGFPMSRSGAASGAASADASVVSSGIASPVKGGQLSPWLLEAQALVEESDEESPVGRGPAAAWAMEPSTDSLLLSLEEELLGPQHKGLADTALAAAVVEPKESVADEPVLVNDEDELEKVEMFVQSPNKATPEQAEDKGKPQQTPPEAPLQPALDWSTIPGYAVGEKVSYFSASHNAWMPARVVERKSKNVYVIDKQMRGCLSKVKASELVSELEEKSNPVLKAFTALEVEPSPAEKKPSTWASAGGTSSPGSSTSASNGSRSPPVMIAPKGRVVRDDFSSDEED
mmetsp:Transcript_19568/g.34549  ORF Transcript_19568/g.34549 Transcript_19568/m.34549 type:complete len:605 (+) Transcript_19568:114-1928(+)|eukprot:CAMPEP_0197660436 /NCGR_PEP_ID=MMETSP1338-20131121/50841_1 /TAXON_ID=43686 ORGANISM="Pelagodinium beii, Strain RCC1491" /NCGR_SAMPLE_ID=MMETSP1338 /ASSEMBLY_ACC=CAM_ASM_000754 /LENGTH=604 /DNA_ID=CAMNT_0043237781 /DNA_START=114 /DNA_END=1928 /DNA_ORIENTATION=+